MNTLPTAPPTAVRIERTTKWRKAHRKLTKRQRAAVDAAVDRFRRNPFDPALKRVNLYHDGGGRLTSECFRLCCAEAMRVIVLNSGEGYLLVWCGTHERYNSLVGT